MEIILTSKRMRTSLEHCSSLARNLHMGCRNFRLFNQLKLITFLLKKFRKNAEKFQKSLSNMDKSLCMYTEVFALIKRMRSGLVGILKFPRGQLRSYPTWLSNKQ